MRFSKLFGILVLMLLVVTVHLKQTAYTTYRGWGKFDPPYRIELQGEALITVYGISGVSKEGKKILIPWDAIAWVESD